MQNLIMGIDGGGTSCRAAVANRAGMILGRGKSGPANIMTDAGRAVTHIIEAARAAMVDAKLDPALFSTVPAFLGLAGHNIVAAVEDVSQQLPFARFEIQSDGLIALEGAVGPGDGSVAILGTGSVFLYRHKGQLGSKGGWGFDIADHGSGARLGHRLFEICLWVHDSIRPGSGLTDNLLAEFGGDPNALVSFAHDARPADFGCHAPSVFEAAAKGDPNGLFLVREAAAHVDATLDAVAAVCSGPVSLLGGLSGLYPPFLAERHRERLVAPRADALTGAVDLARSRFVDRKGDAA